VLLVQENEWQVNMQARLKHLLKYEDIK
jgi:hypothetical protein